MKYLIAIILLTCVGCNGLSRIAGPDTKESGMSNASDMYWLEPAKPPVMPTKEYCLDHVQFCDIVNPGWENK